MNRTLPLKFLPTPLTFTLEWLPHRVDLYSAFTYTLANMAVYALTLSNLSWLKGFAVTQVLVLQEYFANFVD